MATIQEAQASIQQQRDKLEQQRQQILRQRLQAPTRAQLQKQSLQGQVKRKAQERKLAQQKRLALAKVQKYEEKVIQPYESQVSSVQKKQAEAKAQYEAQVGARQKEINDWALAEKLVRSGRESASRGDPSVASKVRKLKKGAQMMALASASAQFEEPVVKAPDWDIGKSSTNLYDLASQTGTYIRDPEHKAQIEQAFKELEEGTYVQPDVSKFTGGVRTYSSGALAGQVTEKIDPYLDKVSITLSPISQQAEAVFTASELKELQTPTFLENQPYQTGGTAYIEPRTFSREELERMPFLGHEQIQKNVEKDIQNQARQLQLDYQNQLKNEYENRYTQAVKEAKSQVELDKAYDKINLDYETDIRERVQVDLDPSIKEAEQYLKDLGIKGRIQRGVALAPFVFGESFALGGALRGGIGAISKVSKTAGIGAEIGTTAGFGLMLASSSQSLTGSFLESPLAFAVENVPVVAGFVTGANPRVVKDLGIKAQKFLEFEQRLIADKRGSFQLLQQKKITKGRFDALTKALDNKRTATFEETKKAIKKANKPELQEWVKQQKKLIDDNLKLSPEERLLQKQKLGALVLEAKTGVSIFTESGSINVQHLNKAISESGISVLKEQLKPRTLAGIKEKALISQEDIIVTSEKQPLTPRQNLFVSDFVAQTPSQKPRLAELQASSSFQQQLIKQELATIQKSNLFTSSASALTPRSAQAQAQKPRLAELQASKLKQKQITRPKLRPKIRIETPFTFGIPTRKAKQKMMPLGKPIQEGDNFIGEIKRFGKWFPITKPTTKKKAKAKAVRRVEDTLGASLRVTRNKQPVPLKVPSGFRKSKINPFILVEKRNLRLSSRKERSDIQKAKKRSPKKKKPKKLKGRKTKR